MANGRNAHLYIDGNAALKIDDLYGKTSEATIIPFPRSCPSHTQVVIPSNSTSLFASAKAKLKAIVEGSEMYCSLRLEDFRGCPYHMFTSRGIAALSVSTAVLAVASIIMGY